MKSRWSSRALADIAETVLYIRRDSPDAALRFVKALESVVNLVVEMPGLGAMEDFGQQELSGMRYLPVHGFRNYLVFYRTGIDTLEIVRVLHSARDIRSLFSA